MRAHDPAITRLVERAARLDEAPEDEWFYADLAQLAAATVADVVRSAIADAFERGRQDGHATGFDAGWRAASTPTAFPALVDDSELS